MTDDALKALAEEIKVLSPPNRLRLAADIMERRRGDVAHAVAAPVIEELGAVLALRRLEKRATPEPGGEQKP